MAMLAAFRTLLARLTGQRDLCIGTPMTLRDTPELRDVVGCLVNPVVLRSTVDLARSFRDQLQVERAGALDAFQHRAVPFSRVVQAVAPERQLGVHPLFQILFSWEPAVPAVTASDGVEFDILPLPAARASYFDLECSLRDEGEGAALSGYFAWSTTAIEDWVAEQLPARLRTLLADVVLRPDEPLERAALLDAGERRRVVLEWNATAAPLPAARSLHGSFVAQAARTPGAVAIRAGTSVVRYGELADASAALAAELMQRGVQGRHVGIALGRSPDLVLAVLAVLRAGGTVVPLDPSFPPARLEFMARDADLALLLVGGASGAAARQAGTPLFDLDAWPRPAAGTPPPVVLPEVPDDAPAMMLYTSGSTGQPKGARTTHLCAVNRCHWMWGAFGFGGDEVFALRTSLNFIDAWWEIFGALGHGVPLQVVPDDVATDPLRLPGFLAATGVTQLVLVPSFLRAILEQLSATGGSLPALRWCITSGEPLTPGLVADCRRLLPGMTVLNTYGTSEIWDATAFDTRAARSRRGARAHRQAGGEHPRVRGGPGRRDPAARHPRRAAGRGSRRRAGLLAEAGTDGGEVRLSRLARGAGGTRLPHRGPGPLPAGRHGRVPRPSRRAVQAAGTAHRTGGDRAGTGPAPRRGRGGRRTRGGGWQCRAGGRRGAVARLDANRG